MLGVSIFDLESVYASSFEINYKIAVYASILKQEMNSFVKGIARMVTKQDIPLAEAWVLNLIQEMTYAGWCDGDVTEGYRSVYFLC